ncbi:MAG: hypothetical protein PUC65_15250 [Clostridiales bacterium]|nr:hypothetical protein [Clostridiales bacterium]
MYKNRKYNNSNENMMQRGEHRNQESRFFNNKEENREMRREMTYDLLLGTMKVLWHS